MLRCNSDIVVLVLLPSCGKPSCLFVRLDALLSPYDSCEQLINGASQIYRDVGKHGYTIIISDHPEARHESLLSRFACTVSAEYDVQARHLDDCS